MSGFRMSIPKLFGRGHQPTPPPVTISPPVNTALPTISGTLIKGQVLTVSDGTWLNSPTAFHYQWRRAGSPIGADQDTYLLIAGDVGTSIDCLVTALNAAGGVSAAAPAVSPIIDLAPVNTAAPVLSGVTIVGRDLTVTNGVWSNSPLSFHYFWLRNGTPITGAANQNTYTLQAGDTGAEISCQVQATNSGGLATADSNQLGPITAGTVPVVTSVTLDGIPQEGQDGWIYIQDDGTANKWQIDIKDSLGASVTGVTISDGAVTSTVNMPHTVNNSAIRFVFPTAIVGAPYTVTGAASADGGANFSAPVTADENFSYPSTFITPAAIGVLSGTRDSASGTVAMRVTLALTNGWYDSYAVRIEPKLADGTSRGISYAYPSVNGDGTISFDLSGASDPLPVPAIPTLNTDDTVSFAATTGHFRDEGGAAPMAGLISNVITFPVTDIVGGSRYWKLHFPTYGAGQVILSEVALATTVGGVNAALHAPLAFIPSIAGSGYLSGGSFDIAHWVDGDSTNIGALDANDAGFPMDVIFDLGTAKALHELRMTSRPDFNAGPVAFTLTPCAADGTPSGAAVVTAAGLTWSGTIYETKTWSF
jgi:hypothetical protein